MNLHSKLKANPPDTDALLHWGTYMRTLRHKEVTKRLRKIRHSTLRAGGEFLQEPSSRLLRPFESSPVSPTPESALSKLPHFWRGPPVGPRGASKLLRDRYKKHPRICGEPRAWTQFVSCLNAPKGKAVGMHLARPHLLGCLPESSQWTLYHHIYAIWTTGVLSTSLTNSRVTPLYKKGAPRDASNYKPAAVLYSMYQTRRKLIFLCLKKPQIAALSPQQAGGGGGAKWAHYGGPGTSPLEQRPAIRRRSIYHPA